MRLNKIKALFFAMLLVPGLVFVGEVTSSNVGPFNAAAQTVTVRRTSRSVGRSVYRGGRWVVRKTWNGTKWVSRRVWVATKWTGRKTWHGTKKVGRAVKRAVT